MPTTKSLKGQLGFIKQMQKLIESLKDIDSAHFQTMFKSKESKFEDFDKTVREFLAVVHSIGDIVGSSHPLIVPKTGRCGIVVFSSDAGFMGKLNTLICREAYVLVEDLTDAGHEVELIVLGKKGLVRMRYLEKATVTPFPAITEKKKYEQVVSLRQYLIKARLEGKIGDLYLVHPKALSFAKQEVVTLRLLPAIDLFKDKVTLKIEKWQSICLESELDDIITYLVENWVTEKLYDAAFESKLSEFAARTNHLEGSLEYLREEIKRLSLLYNKSRQSDIDTGMRETFASLMGS